MSEIFELPSPKKIVSTNISTPIPIPVEIKKLPKKEINIREADNGYIVRVFAGDFNEEWVFPSLNKAVKAIVAFLNTSSEE